MVQQDVFIDSETSCNCFSKGPHLLSFWSQLWEASESILTVVMPSWEKRRLMLWAAEQLSVQKWLSLILPVWMSTRLKQPVYLPAHFEGQETLIDETGGFLASAVLAFNLTNHTLSSLKSIYLHFETVTHQEIIWASVSSFTMKGTVDFGHTCVIISSEKPGFKRANPVTIHHLHKGKWGSRGLACLPTEALHWQLRRKHMAVYTYHTSCCWPSIHCLYQEDGRATNNKY